MPPKKKSAEMSFNDLLSLDPNNLPKCVKSMKRNLKTENICGSKRKKIENSRLDKQPISDKKSLKSSSLAPIKPKKNMGNKNHSVGLYRGNNKENCMMSKLNNISIMLEDSIHRCSQCNVICFNKMIHLLECHKDETTECPHCQQNVAVSLWETHILKCLELFLNIDSIPRHHKNSEEANSVSSERKVSFKTQPNVENISFSCEFCTMKFTNETFLIEHIKIVNNIWRCLICDELYPSESCTEFHLKLRHQSDRRPPMKINVDNNFSIDQLRTHNSIRKMIMDQTVSTDDHTNDGTATNTLEKDWQQTWDVLDDTGSINDNVPTVTVEKVAQVSSIKVPADIPCFIDITSDCSESDHEIIDKDKVVNENVDTTSVMSEGFKEFTKLIAQTESQQMLEVENDEILQGLLLSAQRDESISNDMSAEKLCFQNESIVELVKYKMNETQELPINQNEAFWAKKRRKSTKNEESAQEKLFKEPESKDVSAISTLERDWHQTWDVLDDTGTINDNVSALTVEHASVKVAQVSSNKLPADIPRFIDVNSECCESDNEVNDIDDIANEYMDTESVISGGFNEFTKLITQTEFQKNLDNDDEEILRSVLLPPERENSVDVDMSAKETDVQNESIVDLVKDMMNKSVELPIDKKNELIYLAKKRRKLIEKENIIKAEILKEAERKKNEITYLKLINMENKEDFQIEIKLSEVITDLECASTVVTDNTILENEEYLANEQIEVSQEEIDNILEIYYNRKPITIDFELSEYKGQQDVENLSVIANYECHKCDKFSTESFNAYYDHLWSHKNDINSKVPFQERGQCMICDLIVPLNLLSSHIVLHKDHVKCPICKLFIHENDYESHVLAHKNHFKCTICGDVFKSIVAIRKHVTHHKKGTSYICEQCNCTFCSLEKLVAHISHVHKSIDVGFAECIFCYELTDEIKNHMYSPDHCKLKCRACLKVMKTPKEFLSHFLFHVFGTESTPNNSARKVYRCDVCGYSMASLDYACHHVKAHKVDALYFKHVKLSPRIECGICKTIMLKSYYDYHVKKHHYYDNCTICSKLVLKNNMQEHLSAHETDFICGKCEETFSTKKNLEDHMWGHGRLIQRPCDQCKLVFNSEVARVRHISYIHKKIDPVFVECLFCKELLMTDIDYHLLDYPRCSRRCKLCNMRFKSSTLYEAHVLHQHKQFLEVPSTS